MAAAGGAAWWPAWSPWSAWARAAPSSSRRSWSGAIFVAAGLATEQLDLDAAVVLTSTLVFVVIVGSVFPWLALGATGTNVDQLYSVADITADPDDIDPEQVGADARTAHEILVGRLRHRRAAARAGRAAGRLARRQRHAAWR